MAVQNLSSSQKYPSVFSLLCLTCTDFPIEEICALLGYYEAYYGTYRRFGTTCQSHLKKNQAVLGRFEPWKWDPIVCPETSSSIHQPALCKISKDSRSHSFRGGSLKLCIVNSRTWFWHFADLNIHTGNDTRISNIYMQRETILFCLNGE
jgi:hypothetical protein